MQLQWSDQAALTVVMAARGYPGSYAKGGAIAGLDSISTAKVISGACDHCDRHICTLLNVRSLGWCATGSTGSCTWAVSEISSYCKAEAQHVAMLWAESVRKLHACICASIRPASLEC